MNSSRLKPPAKGQKPGKQPKRSHNTPDPRQHEKKRERTFLPHWKTKFIWLNYEEDSGLMFCQTCKDFPDNADRKSSLYTGCSNFRLPILESHADSGQHLKCEAAKAASTSEKPRALLEGLQKMENNLRVGMINLFHIAYHVIKGDHPFTEFPKLKALAKKTGNNVPACYDSDMSCAWFLIDIVGDQFSRTLQDIKSANFLSVMIDGEHYRCCDT